MKAIIIGSGIGGLGMAIRLAVRGYEVDVLEKSSTPGGKMAELSVDGFRFDMGPSLLTLPGLIEELFVLAGKKSSDYLEILPLDTTCNYFFPDGSNLKAWSNKDRFASECEMFGMSRKVVDRYLDRQSFLYQNTADFFLFNSIHRPSTYVGKAGQQSLKALHRLDAFVSMHKRNSKTFRNKNITQLFDRYATYNGSDPYRAPATLNMIAHLEHNTGAYFPKNGMHGVVSALVRLAEELGVTIHLNAEVNGLATEHKRVTSVLTNKGVFFADIVVNNTDITYFYKNILPDKKRFNQLSRRERSSSALIFYWGIRHVSDLDVHNILFSKDYPAEFRGLFKEKRFADDLTVYIFISSKVVPEDAPQGCENWFVMVNAPENVGQNWPEETERARRIIMQKIENMLGFSVDERIVNEHVVGPVDIERRTSSVNGSLYGHSSNSALAAFLRHPNFSPKFKNLYFVGGSVHPGGGIPLCLASAKIVDGMIKPAKS